jgi:uncharacterized tellurite resistance protein B-like protein
MSTYKEKLSILSELILFAKADNVVTASEYNFLLSVALLIGVDKKTFNSLFTREVEKVLPKNQADSILQFHRLVLLMNVDCNRQPSEVKKLYNIGLSMGLPPSAVEQVLSIMHQYPNNVVPPEVLINIFKAHYN